MGSSLTRLLALGCLIGGTALAAPPIRSNTSQLDVVRKFSGEANKVAKAWYSRICALLGVSDDSKEPIELVFDFDYDGVAATGGHKITISAKYVAKHPGDIGMVIHELCHVVQGYPKYDPVWLVEGIADWVRWFNFEPIERQPKPTAAKAIARASYRTTAAFLDWCQGKYDPKLIQKLDAALRTATYQEGIWKDLTSRSLDELDAEWKASLSPHE